MRSVTFVLMLGVVLVALAACGGGDSEDPTATPVQPASPPAPASAPATAPAPAAAPAAAPATGGTAVTVSLLDAGGRGPFVFDPVDFTYSAGTTVDFKFVGDATFHTFTVDDLGIDVEVNGGETVDFSFTFDAAGSYELICIPHEALGMVGTITIN
jgi:plastocyanin